MSETRDDKTRNAEKRNADLDTCPTCGSDVHVVGRTTMYYEPAFLAQYNAVMKAFVLEVDKNSVLQAKYAAMMEAYAAAGDENLDLQLTVAELRAVVDSMKRIEAQRYKSAADALGLTPPAQAAAKSAGG